MGFDSDSQNLTGRAATREPISRAAVWRCYSVSVLGFPAHVKSARSAAAAKYEAFLSYSECRDISFRDFLKIVRVRACQTPEDGCYDYVRRAYGVEVRPGQRVLLRNEGPDWNGREVVVVHPGRSSTSMVHIAVDGLDHSLVVHPDNVQPLPEASAGYGLPHPRTDGSESPGSSPSNSKGQQ